jgi:hypothetical protein
LFNSALTNQSITIHSLGTMTERGTKEE